MKHLLLIAVVILTNLAATAQPRIDITPRWDTARVLLNPDKGWYHHYMDNGVRGYGLQSEAELDTFPGMHHLFIRIAWAFLEPEEGHFNWETIDTVIARYTPKGYKLSLDITCKETSGKRMPYATPQWVERAGAKGRMVESWGSDNWEPDYNDPIFLEKLNNFHRAMAARYDGAEWLQDVTTGSIGEWGEGHSSRNVRAEVVIKHLEILLGNYKKTQINIGDDYLRAGKTAEETKRLREFVKRHRIGYRDDSVFWEGVMSFPGSIQNPDFFEDVWRTTPTTLELCHYNYCRDRFWSVPNGAERGLDTLMQAIRIAHATFVSFHGHVRVWQRDNPQAAWAPINLMGYHLAPEWCEAKLINGRLQLSVAWRNLGVAPPYKPYKLQVFLTGEDGVRHSLPAVDAGNARWLPGTSVERYNVSAPALTSGRYRVDLRLFKPFADGHTQTVKLGLSQHYEMPDGAYEVGEIVLK